MLSPQTRLQPSRVIKSPQWFTAIQEWFRQEIVDDDPWDTETLFADSLPGRRGKQERQNFS